MPQSYIKAVSCCLSAKMKVVTSPFVFSSPTILTRCFVADMVAFGDNLRGHAAGIVEGLSATDQNERLLEKLSQ
jgi:hypothetical protein